MNEYQFENELDAEVINPELERMISKWKRIQKNKRQYVICHEYRKLNHKRKRKEILNNGNVF